MHEALKLIMATLCLYLTASLLIPCASNARELYDFLLLVLLAQDIIILAVKYKHNVAMIILRASCKHSYLLIHILKLNLIKTGNLAKQVSSTC